MSDIKKLLEGIQQQDNRDRNVYKQLELIMTKILLENPKNFEKNRNEKMNLNIYDMFEDMSLAIKTTGLDIQDNHYRMKEDCSEIEQYVQKAQNLLNKPKQTTDDDEPQEQGPCGYMPNLLEEIRLFEWAGVYFGKDETYLLYKSLIKLGIAKAVKNIRLWGKINCSKRDYYIAEGLTEGTDEQEVPSHWEPKGTGVNKNVYWVITDILGDWIELPIVSPDQIKVARKIKYLFTGDLERKVITNPNFDGQEKHLLKAQIVRISHSTTIIPNGIYKLTEDDPKEIEPIDPEEAKPLGFEQLLNPSNWVHHSQSILKEGRLVHFKPEPKEDEDEEKMMKEIEAKDPFQPRLKPISQDQGIKGWGQAWKLSQLDDCTNYQINGFVNAKVNYGIICLQSLVWPGQYTIYSQGQQQSIYVGNGFKASSESFYPKEPQVVLQEPQDIEEQPEPQMPKEEEVKDQD